jgi:RepB DNA-primase N-terminal domain
MDLPPGLDAAARVMGIATCKDREAHKLVLRMARPRSRTNVRCFACGMMVCDHHAMFKTSLSWCDDAEDLARLDSYCMQDVRTERALCNVLPPPSQSEGEIWLRDQVISEPGMAVDTLLTERASPIAERPAVTTTQVAPKIVPDEIRDHVRLIHILAEPLAGRGKVVATGFGEDPDQIDPKTRKPGRRLHGQVIHADIGDVRGTLEGIAQFMKRPHYNLYMPLAIYGADLASGQKGSEEDVVACLGIVADFDDPDAPQWAERLPIPPNYVLETSAGRFQAFYLFDKPEALDDVKPVAQRLKAFAKCDTGTSDISHVWRVPGALNWPNAKKVAEGRARNPQLVRVEKWDNSRTSLQSLSDALPQGEPVLERKERASTST